MPTKPTFETIGDEPIEARIVAWVLGDASAFEETELERLCDERPELLVFRRRMRALHGLLTDAEAAATDHSTKLPPEKRRVLDEIFGVESAGKTLAKPQPARVRRRWPQRLLAIAACVALLAVLGGLAHPRFLSMSKKFSSAGEPVPLKIDYPPELLEGTPRAIVLNSPKSTPVAPAATTAPSPAAPVVLPQSPAGKPDLLARRRDAPRPSEEPAAPPPAAKPADSTLALRGAAKPGEAKPGGESGKLQPAANAKRPLGEVTREKLGLADEEVQDAEFGDMDPLSSLGGAGAVPGSGGLANTKPRSSSDLAVSRAKRVVAEGARSTYTMPNQTDHFGAMPPLPSNGTVAGNLGGSGSGHGFGAVPPVLPALPSVGHGVGRGIGAGSGPGPGNSPSSAMQPQHLAGPFGGGGAGALGDVAAAEMPASGPVAGELSGAVTRAPAAPPAAPPAASLALAENDELIQKALATESRSGIGDVAKDDRKGGLKSDLSGLAQADLFDSYEERTKAPTDPFAPTDGRANALALGGLGKELPGPETAHKPTAADTLTDRSESSARLAGAKPQTPAKSRSDASQLADPGTGAPGDVPKTEQVWNFGLEPMALRPFQAPGKDEPDAPAPSATVGGKWVAGAEVGLDKPVGERGTRGEEEGRKGDKLGMTGSPTGFTGLVDSGAPPNGPQDQNGKVSIDDLRNGNGAINKNSIDAILDDKGALGRSDGDRSGAVQGAAGGQEGGIPASDKNPLVGALFGDKEADRQGQAEHREAGLNANTTDAYLWAERAKQLRHDGRDDDAHGVFKEAWAADPNKPATKNEAESLDDPIRTSPALSYEHRKLVDDVRRGLYTAEGNFNLGKYDEAKREYEKVLRTDPYNQAARRGLEGVASAKSDSYRATYDKTRAELLTEFDLPADAPAKTPEAKSTSDLVRDFDAKSKVAAPAESVPAGPAAATTTPSSHESDGKKVELAKLRSEEKAVIPAGKDAYGGETTVSAGTVVSGGTLELKEGGSANPAAEGEQSGQVAGLAQREMIRRQLKLVDSDRYLSEARDAFTKSNYQQAYDNYAKALDLLPDAPATKDRREFLRKALGDVAVALANDAIKNGKNDEAREWLGKAVAWDPNNEAARQKAVADVASEITAADAPYSTFSLSISDASFKMAQAALARGERPEPSSIKIEQFYNAVDYGDPAPGPGEAVAGWVEQAAHPVIPGRNLVRVAMRTGAAGRSAAQPLRLTLLVDQSGSMARDDRRAAMTFALKQLAGLLTKYDLVTVIGFSRTPRLLADALTGDQGAKLKEVVNQAAIEGGTNLEEAMKLGEQMALRHLTAGAQNRIVLFTDGAANLGDADPSRLADKVTAMRQKGLAFDIAGIGTSNLNDLLLAELARHGNGRYCVVGAEKDAGGSFARQLAGAFRPAAENVKVQVRFNPQRVGRYKLLGFEEHRLKTEDFHNDAVDAAELAAEEAGVALYQVEPLADGSGEIGEASVRFRDAASGQMVERSWTIPYEPNALAFDRAAPSLQLAGLAMLAAEKLRGGPLADAIDFKQLATPRATVKQYYSNSRRVAEMLEVVDRL